MTFTILFDIGPNLQRLGANLVSLFSEIQAQIQDLKDAAASEHEQVLAAIAALEAKIGESVSPDEKAQIATLFAEAKSAISGVYEPPAPTA